MEIVAQQGEYALVRVEVRKNKSYGYVVSIPNLEITSPKICLDQAIQDPHWGEPNLSDHRKKQILKVVRDETGAEKEVTHSPAKRKKREGTSAMNADPKRLLTYIQLLESTNAQLVFALKKAIELFKVLNPPGDREQWQETINGFENIVKVAEKLHQQKPKQ